MTTTTTRTRPRWGAARHAAFVLPAALAGVFLLASCGGSTDFNDADVRFAQMMIPHHEQAIEMSKLADGRAGDDVGKLAARIEKAQGPEIRKLEDMLDDWGEKPSSGDMGHGDHGMQGMMSDAQMSDLRKSKGDDFDAAFAEMMIEHHKGAVDMANEEVDAGANEDAIDMAKDIVDAQESEIEEMEGMLGESGGNDGSGDKGDSGDSGHGGH